MMSNTPFHQELTMTMVQVSDVVRSVVLAAIAYDTSLLFA